MTDATATPLSPLEQIAALKAQLKELTAGANEALAADAKAKFEPMHANMTAALAATVNADDPENAAVALKWIGENMTDFRKLGRVYHKNVFGVAAPRKPRTPKSDVEAADTDVQPTEDAPAAKGKK